jgi:hypothetical protein
MRLLSSVERGQLMKRLRAAIQAVQMNRTADALELVEQCRDEIEAHVRAERAPTQPPSAPEPDYVCAYIDEHGNLYRVSFA